MRCYQEQIDKELNEFMNIRESGGGCECQECGRKYKIDFILPDELWETIKPIGKPEGAGLLCGSCIVQNLELFDRHMSFVLKQNITKCGHQTGMNSKPEKFLSIGTYRAGCLICAICGILLGWAVFN